jgi:hypothetical protein
MRLPTPRQSQFTHTNLLVSAMSKAHQLFVVISINLFIITTTTISSIIIIVNIITTPTLTIIG